MFKQASQLCSLCLTVILDLQIEYRATMINMSRDGATFLGTGTYRIVSGVMYSSFFQCEFQNDPKQNCIPTIYKNMFYGFRCIAGMAVNGPSDKVSHVFHLSFYGQSIATYFEKERFHGQWQTHRLHPIEFVLSRSIAVHTSVQRGREKRLDEVTCDPFPYDDSQIL